MTTWQHEKLTPAASRALGTEKLGLLPNERAAQLHHELLELLHLASTLVPLRKFCAGNLTLTKLHASSSRILWYELILSLITLCTHHTQSHHLHADYSSFRLRIWPLKSMPSRTWRRIQIFSFRVSFLTRETPFPSCGHAGKTLWGSHPRFFWERPPMCGKDDWKLFFEVFAVFLLHQIL